MTYCDLLLWAQLPSFVGWAVYVLYSVASRPPALSSSSPTTPPRLAFRGGWHHIRLPFHVHKTLFILIKRQMAKAFEPGLVTGIS